jgi:hypothetical protein
VTFGAAFLFDAPAARVYSDLLPGAYVAVFGGPDASIEARQSGLHLKDTMLVLRAGPSSDLVSLFRKPLDEATIAEQVLKTGTGGLHIDACRIQGDMSEFFSKTTGKPRSGMGHAKGYGMGEGYGGDNANPPHARGRWPANLVLVHDTGCKLIGFERIEGHKGYPNGPGGSSSQFSQKGTATTRTGAWAGHADADGKESVPTWLCAPGCAREALDSLNVDLRGGASRFYPQFPDIAGFLEWMGKLILPPGAVLFR